MLKDRHCDVQTNHVQIHALLVALEVERAVLSWHLRKHDLYNGGREGYIGKRNKKIMLWMYVMVESCVQSQTYSNTAMENIWEPSKCEGVVSMLYIVQMQTLAGREDPSVHWMVVV